MTGRTSLRVPARGGERIDPRGFRMPSEALVVLVCRTDLVPAGHDPVHAELNRGQSPKRLCQDFRNSSSRRTRENLREDVQVDVAAADDADDAAAATACGRDRERARPLGDDARA